jgi:Flp pilus assembly protein TadG
MSSLRTSPRAGDLYGHERGQGVVEFALILPLFVLLVAGIVQFGIGLNYWLDLQRVANQGARWAAVNNWPPECPAGTANSTNGGSGCTATPACNAASRTGATLQNMLYCQLLTKGESNTTVEVCYPSGSSGAVGDPVTVRLTRPFKVIGIPFLPGGFGNVTIRGSATMRLEQSQAAADNGLLTGVNTC